MLFEPCGELRKDYGAYCETLRLTEREELYKGLLTTVERQALLEGPRGRLTLLEEASRELGVRDSEGAGGRNDLFGRRASSRASMQTTIAASESAASAAALEAAAAAAAGANADQSMQSTPGRQPPAGKKKSKKEVKPVEVEEAAEEPWVPVPSLTFVSLRHPKFCINQRDITPLCRAMPHCPSLVEVSLVGCGLSLESYLLLVEAVYRSPRVVTVVVDFNHLTRPGFGEDPTAPPAPPPPPPPPATPTLEAGSEVHNEPSASGTPAEKKPKRKTSLRSSAPPVPAQEEEPGTLLLKPSEYCGQCHEPSPLEEQIQEEREKKGKVDPKKLQSLQAQQEAVAHFDLTHPIKAPRGWAAMLLTGVRSLSLRGNGIDDAAVRLMVDYLLYNPRTRLISLNLWGNAITDHGAREVARLLLSSTTLRSLDLGHNAITDDGMLALVDAFRLQELPTLEEAAAYRQRVLQRPTATEAERAAAHHTMPAPPSYQDLYQLWHARRYPPAQEEKRENKRTAKKSKADALLSFVRSTQPYDRDCVRLSSEAASPVRVPGNVTLEALNLGGNMDITVDGMAEAARRLLLREPTTDEDMESLAMASLAAGVLPPDTAVATTVGSPTGSRNTSLSAAGVGAAGGVAVPPPPLVPAQLAVLAPETYVGSGVRLRSLVLYSPSFGNASRETRDWTPQREAQLAINDALNQLLAEAEAAAAAIAAAQLATSSGGKGGGNAAASPSKKKQ